MKVYRITAGVVRLDAGHLIVVNERQYGLRSHKLELIERAGRSFRVKVKAKETVEFKAGEIIGLAQVPRAFQAVLEPLERKIEPKTAAAA